MTTDAEFTLYDYWRSSACYRVRIALNLKHLRYAQKPVHLVRNGGEQHSVEHRALNPQEAIPVLVHGTQVIRQSLAIMEYLEESDAAVPRLLTRWAQVQRHSPESGAAPIRRPASASWT